MKALSIKQPWASLIIEGIKDVENRTWKTSFRGRVYVHASQTPVPCNGLKNGVCLSANQILLIQGRDGKWPIEKFGRFPDIFSRFVNSAIIGEVDIIDCVLKHPSIWADHEAVKFKNGTEVTVPVYNWVLANPVKYDTPILNVKGALSFWQPDPYILAI